MLRGCGAVAQELEAAVHDNLRNLGLDVLDVVNMRLMFDVMGPAEGDIEAHITALATLQQRGLIRHIGLSNATAQQVQQAHGIADIVCVQNQYNLVHRHDDSFIDRWRRRASPTCRSSRWAASRHCNRPSSPRWLLNCKRRRCRLRWPGCCSVRPTSC
jgi:aryl-alcohol dehydrogenase-like predicted oxidoreductase